METLKDLAEVLNDYTPTAIPAHVRRREAAESARRRARFEEMGDPFAEFYRAEKK